MCYCERFASTFNIDIWFLSPIVACSGSGGHFEAAVELGDAPHFWSVFHYILVTELHTVKVCKVVIFPLAFCGSRQ